MKKLLMVAVCAVVLWSSYTFAQYPGWGSTYSPSAGYSTFALNRDICTNGDTSLSLFDGLCGDVGSQLLVTGPNSNLVKKVKRRRISFTRLIRQLPVLNNLFQ